MSGMRRSETSDDPPGDRLREGRIGRLHLTEYVPAPSVEALRMLDDLLALWDVSEEDGDVVIEWSCGSATERSDDDE